MIGTANAAVANGKLYYIHTDHLGTPKALTNESGTKVWSATHDPFGLATVDPGSTVEMNIRFPGQYFDSETGLHHNGFRTYDPATGRYITSDPIGQSGGLNTYLYAEANPITNIDPYGLATVFIWRAGAGSAYGHTSVLSNRGNYLSHHPGKTGLNPTKSLFRTYSQDTALYGREPDFAVYVDLPDELAADQFINDYKRNEDYWGVFGNCADAVSDTLNAGQLGLDSLNVGPLDSISYPAELENELRGVYWRHKNIFRDVVRH